MIRGAKAVYASALCGFAVLLTMAAVEVKGAAPARSWAVVTTIADAQNGWPLRVESDHLGSYTTTKQIDSEIQGGGDWTLTTYSANSRPSNRTVFFDLREPASPSITPPFTTAYVQTHLIAKCDLVNVNMQTMHAGTTARCPGSFRFLAPNGLWYRFSFQPDNFPEVDYMNITCTATDSAGCKLWNIYPSGTNLTGSDPNCKNLNRLVQIDPYRPGHRRCRGFLHLIFHHRFSVKPCGAVSRKATGHPPVS